MIRQEDVYKIGRTGKPHGVSGEINLTVDDDVFDRTDAEYLVLDVDGILVPFFIEEYRFRSDTTAIMKFEGTDNLEDARALTGCDVFFPKSLADNYDEARELAGATGYAIIDSSTGQTVGTVTAIDDSTANVLFVTETPDGGELLIPASEDLIRSVDPDSRTVTMTLPEGLVGIN